jgi:hypothetical protein
VSVYTVRFYLGELPVAWTSLFKVPAGSVYILRDIEIFSVAAQSGPLYMSVQPASGGSAQVFGAPELAANSHLQWVGRVALGAGDQVFGYSSSSGPSVIVTGYEFPS